MATSFIRYKKDGTNKGFWINDWFIELVAEYIYQVIEKDQKQYSENILDLNHDSFNIIRQGLSPSANDPALYLYIKTPKDEQVFLEILEKTKELLRSKGPEISDKELTSYEMQKLEELRRIPLRKKTLGRTESTAGLIQIIDEIIKMIVEKDEYDGSHHDPLFNFTID